MKVGLLVEGICPSVNKFIHTLVQQLVEGAVLGFWDGWRGLCDDQPRKISVEESWRFQDLGGSILSSSFLREIPRSFKFKMIQNLVKNDVELLVVVGNTMSFLAAYELFSAGVKVVFIPSADFVLNQEFYRMGFSTVVNKISECIYRFKNLSLASGRGIVLRLSKDFKDLIEKMRYLHNFFFTEADDHLLLWWNNPCCAYDCVIKVDGILVVSKPLAEDLALARGLAKAIPSFLTARGGVFMTYRSGFEILPFQKIREISLVMNQGGT
ncbi:6-phosphofructokinase [Pseudothermotoga sp. U03pept]|uniref:6-phosphofructokinase n=1 Tax=Pseudothermotoga sp. U03pept TaxID=3447012 RepID=UPI003F0794CD